MTCTPYLAGLAIGFVAGFGLCYFLWQLAYRLGLIEYKGSKQ